MMAAVFMALLAQIVFAAVCVSRCSPEWWVYDRPQLGTAETPRFNSVAILNAARSSAVILGAGFRHKEIPDLARTWRERGGAMDGYLDGVALT